MNRLELASSAIHEKAQEVLRRYRPELDAAGVLASVFVSRKLSRTGEYENCENSLTCNRQPAWATIRLAKDSERALGSGDVVIVIDYHAYTHILDDRNRDALFFHELCHVKPKTSKSGSILRHPDGRPRLQTVPHDVEVGVFMEPIQILGKAASDYLTAYSLFMEVRNAHAIHVERRSEEIEAVL